MGTHVFVNMDIDSSWLLTQLFLTMQHFSGSGFFSGAVFCELVSEFTIEATFRDPTEAPVGWMNGIVEWSNPGVVCMRELDDVGQCMYKWIRYIKK